MLSKRRLALSTWGFPLALPLAMALSITSAGCGGPRSAAPLGKPLGDVSKDDLKLSLEKGGWKVVQSNEASSGRNRTYSVFFGADGRKGRARYVWSPNEATRKGNAADWESEKAAVRSDDKAVLAVDVEGDAAGGKRILDAMLPP